VGQGTLRECLLDGDVDAVLSVGRSTTGQTHAKLREITHADFTDLTSIAGELTGYDACFFCLGVSSAGMKEAEYRHVTYDFALAAAQVLAQHNAAMTFVYVSGAGTDSSEKGRTMWARVKGETENALLRLPFKAAYMFRPGAIQPLHGIKSKTRIYRAAYVVMAPLWPVLRAMFPATSSPPSRSGAPCSPSPSTAATRSCSRTRTSRGSRASRHGVLGHRRLVAGLEHTRNGSLTVPALRFRMRSRKLGVTSKPRATSSMPFCILTSSTNTMPAHSTDRNTSRMPRRAPAAARSSASASMTRGS